MEHIQIVQDFPTSHDLPCVEEQDSDSYVKIYAMVKPPSMWRCDIPDFVHYSKINSNNKVNCVQQNGRDYCLLPFSDLMVYTDKEVIWSDIPSVIEVHKIIKN